jgi:D-alanyl-D-alanine carboxypeptidase (penicillin-binding protein 5/6)
MRKIFLFLFVLQLSIKPVNTYAIAGSAKSACLINAVTGEVLYEKNSAQQLPMASTTKIMTLLTALEEADMDETVNVSYNADMAEGSSAYIETGAQIEMKDLLYGLMLNSGNDAAIAVAEHISGSEEAFAQKMNMLAKKIGAENTQFKNPNGLDSEGHFTTAADLAKIAGYAMKNSQFREIVSSRIYKAEFIRKSGEKKELEYINHNRLLREYDGCVGVKTGFTKLSGRCLVSAAERDGALYIAVTLNSPDDWKEHKQMLDYAFSDCETVKAITKGECIKHIKGKEDECKLVASEDFIIPYNGGRHDINLSLNLPDKIDMPLNAGEKIGYADIISDGRKVGEVDILADDNFVPDEKNDVKTCFGFVFKNIIRNIL